MGLDPSFSLSEDDKVELINSSTKAFIVNGYGKDINSTEFKPFFNKYETAYTFYRQSGYKNEEISGHLNGIDFNQPVQKVTIPPPFAVQQFQSAVPKFATDPSLTVEKIKNEKTLWQGNYYASFGTPPDALGIASKGTKFGTDQVALKVPYAYQVKGPVDVLKSTAAPIKDTWSVKGQTIDTKGGGIQLFCAEKISFELQLRAKVIGPASHEKSEAQEPTPNKPRMR